MNDANNLVDKMLLALESVFYGENSRISYKPEYEELKRFIYFTAPFAGAREIERLRGELSLKDADLLLERDRAEKAEKDAARYRHMRNNAAFRDRNGPGLYWYLPRYLQGSGAEQLDAAIDEEALAKINKPVTTPQ
jgi:hypothetical protein